MKNNLNIVLKAVIYLLICTNAASFFMFAILMQDATSDNFYALLWSTVYPLLMTFILYNILQIKRKALYHLGIIQIANAVLNTLLIDKPILESLFISVGTCLIFAALLCLRKDGVSAWHLLLREYSVLSKEQNSSIIIDEAVVEDTADNPASQNSEDKDSISTDQVKEHIEENIISKESERVISETTAINDEVEDVSLTSLPYKEDGSIDYENMTSVQQFAYTSKTESIKVALMDLNTDIQILEKSIGSIQKELKSLQGGNRAMLRDSLRKEQEKLDELYELRSKYSSKKEWDRKIVSIILAGCIISVLSVFLFILIKDNNTFGGINLKSNKDNIFSQKYTDPQKGLYSYLFDEEYVKFSTFSEFLEYLDDDDNRMHIADKLIKDGYEDFISNTEVEAYLGYKIFCYRCYNEDSKYNVPITVYSRFEEDMPNSYIDFIKDGEIFKIAVREKDQFIQSNPTIRPRLVLNLRETEGLSKRRLLYYGLLGTRYFSKDELGTIDNFLEALNNKENIKNFYWQLISCGFTSGEIGSEEVFCENMLSDLDRM